MPIRAVGMLLQAKERAKKAHKINKLRPLKPGEYREMHADDVQTDPTGKKADEAGAKLDAGKNRMGLVLGDFAPALEQVCKVGTLGANKYSAHGWITVPNGIERYTDAMLRHYFREAMGEMVDPELTDMNEGGEIYHAACVAWNALARLSLILNTESKPNEENQKWVDEQ